MTAKIKFFVFSLLAICVGVAGVELLLQTAGFAASLWLSASADRSPAPDAAHVILCVGESTTAYGSGASYPDLLQELLNKNFGEGKFKVINAGLPGTDTDVILQRMNYLIARHRPKTVISMMGINDYWALEVNSSPWSRLKIVKLARLFHANIKFTKPPPPSSDEDALVKARLEFARGNLEGAKVILSDFNGKAPLPKQAHFLHGAIAARTGKLEEAEMHFQNFIAEPATTEDLLRVGNFYVALLGRMNKTANIIARPYFEKALAKNPHEAKALLSMAATYIFVENNYEKARPLIEKFRSSKGIKFDRRIELISLELKAIRLGVSHKESALLFESAEDIRQLIKTNLFLDDFEEIEQLLKVSDDKFAGDPIVALLKIDVEKRKALRLESKTISSKNFFEFPATRKNYLEMYNKLKAHQLHWIVVQYPKRDVNELKTLLPQSENVHFVDTTYAVKKIESQGGYDAAFIDNFAEDFGHFTPATAAAISEEIIKTFSALL